MANSFFTVDTGIQVGNLTIFSSNGDIITSGNINTAGSAQFDQDQLGNVKFSNTTISTTTAGYNLILDPFGGANVEITGNIVVSGNVFMTSPLNLNSGANSVQPKLYIDLMSVVFGS